MDSVAARAAAAVVSLADYCQVRLRSSLASDKWQYTGNCLLYRSIGLAR